MATKVLLDGEKHALPVIETIVSSLDGGEQFLLYVPLRYDNVTKSTNIVSNDKPCTENNVLDLLQKLLTAEERSSLAKFSICYYYDKPDVGVVEWITKTHGKYFFNQEKVAEMMKK